MTPGLASLNLFGLAAMWLLVAGMVAVGIGLAVGQPRHRLLRALGFQPRQRRRYGALLTLSAVIALAAMALLAGRVDSTLALMVCVMAPPAVAALLDWALPRHQRRRAVGARRSAPARRR